MGGRLVCWLACIRPVVCTLHCADLLVKASASQAKPQRPTLWSRYGTCPCSVASAEMTLPSALRLLLMACASFSCSPTDPDFLTLRVKGGAGRKESGLAAEQAGHAEPAMDHHWPHKCTAGINQASTLHPPTARLAEYAPLGAGQVHKGQLAARHVLGLQVGRLDAHRDDEVRAGRLAVHLRGAVREAGGQGVSRHGVEDQQLR